MPKKYVEKVGDDGFKKAPIGAGPYKFVSFTPGQELVLEAFEGYWRKVPSVKRLVMKVIPDESTRLAALTRGEIDIAYSIRGELAEEVQHTPGLTLKPVVLQAPNWLYFPEQWDPKSPWHDLRVRQAANLAIDREGMNKALFLGYCKTTDSIIPYTFADYWQPPAAVYDPAKAKKLMAEAGYASGFDAGLLYCDSSYANMAEVSLNNLPQIGIRAKLEPIERAGFFAGYANKKYTRGIIQGASAAFGNAATRLGVLCRQGWRLRLWQLSRYRRTLSAAGRRNGPRRSAPRSSPRCSSWFTTRRSTRRSGSSASSTPSDRGSGNRRSARFPVLPIPRLSRISRSRRSNNLA